MINSFNFLDLTFDFSWNERQIKAVMYVKKEGKITNKEYQEITGVSKRTATRDLTELVNRKILHLAGRGKRDLHYILRRQNMTPK